jgi:hypothetical protein
MITNTAMMKLKPKTDTLLENVLQRHCQEIFNKISFQEIFLHLAGTFLSYYILECPLQFTHCLYTAISIKVVHEQSVIPCHTLATMNSASSGLSNCSFEAISSKDILEYDKLIIRMPLVLMTL